jgi:hypothetical protein
MLKAVCKSQIGMRLVNCQWCGEPCFAGAAIKLDGYLP